MRAKVYLALNRLLNRVLINAGQSVFGIKPGIELPIDECGPKFVWYFKPPIQPRIELRPAVTRLACRATCRTTVLTNSACGAREQTNSEVCSPIGSFRIKPPIDYCGPKCIRY